MERVRRTVIVSMSVDSSLSRNDLHQEIEKNLPGTQIIGFARTIPGVERTISEITGADVMIVIEPDMLQAMEAAITAIGEITAPPDQPLQILLPHEERALRLAIEETTKVESPAPRDLASDLREDR